MKRALQITIIGLVMAISMLVGYHYGSHRTGEHDGARAASPATKAEYSCPMHPFIVTQRPGTCPICAMALVKRITGADAGRGMPAVGQVALSPAQQVMANLRTAPAIMGTLERELATTGVVAYNQETQGKVSATLAGRLDRLLVKSVGDTVVKGRAVAELSSYELVTTEEEYLLAYKAVKLFGSSIVPIFTQNSMSSLVEARQKLRMMGFKEEHFAALERAGKPTVHLPIVSPRSGTVTEKLVQEGQYVAVGEPLFAVADLSTVWVELEVFESDIPQVKVGQPVVISAPSCPGETFSGKVKYLYPFLDPKTRTVKVRVELPNPGLSLKPDMYVTASLKSRLSGVLTVPPGAVQDSGRRQTVWVEAAAGSFVPREVKTGARSHDTVQILEGLKPGEKVAVSGGYLIDSEAQLIDGRGK